VGCLIVITQVKLENFKQYRGKHVINFERGLNLIQGLNDSGKSSIFHALSFAFFNQTPTLGIHTTALITNGESFTTVRVDFVDPKTGESLCVIRSKTKTKGEFELRKTRTDGTEETTLSSRAGAREIDLQAKLNEHLDMGKRLFFTVVYSEQKAFVDLARGGSDVKDDMDTLFGLKAAAVMREGFRSVQRDLEKKMVGEEEVKTFLKSLIMDKDRLKKRVQDSSNIIMSARTQLSKLQEEISSMNTIKSTVNRVEAALLNADELAHQLKNKEALVSERNRIINDIIGKYDSNEPLRTQSLGVQRSLIEIEDKERKIRERENKLKENQKEVIQRRGYLINTLSERGSVEGLQICPKCGQEVDKEHINREMNEFKNELEAIEKALSEMTGEVTALELSYKYLEDERRVQERRRATLDADIISFDEASRRVKTAEKEVHALKKMLENALQTRSNISTLTRLDKVSQDLSVKLRDSLFESISSLTYFWYTQLIREKKYTMIGFDPDNYSLLAKPLGFEDLVPVKEYSGGGHETIFSLALRLALSQTAGNRDFMLFDEPTDATDTYNRDQIIEALMKASQSFNQILLITHHGLGREYTVNTIAIEFDPEDRSSKVLTG